jgi:phosphoglycolate phosphatase-like HAD superfamily hydrolase
MTTAAYLEQYDTFVFELDDVIYPVKDYHLQVYYLFGSFMEYTEQVSAEAIVSYMKNAYEEQGNEGVFEKTLAHFAIDEKYLDNFKLLNKTARLPLKLLIFDPVLKFMQDLVVDRKEIYLLVGGDPEQQLNKIRQIEWNGLEQYIRVFFKHEITNNPDRDSLIKFVTAHRLVPEGVMVIANTVADQHMANRAGIKYMAVNELFSA